MSRRALAWALIFALILLSGCGGREVSVKSVLLALTEAEVGLPAGQAYLASAQEDEVCYLPPDLTAALYGQGEPPGQLALVEDYGMWLSSAQHPCEFAVFRCYARSDTDVVAAMCTSRLDDLRAHYKDSQYASYLQNAQVVVIGKYVLLLISADAQHALDTARRAL